jgi:hypothetical protein
MEPDSVATATIDTDQRVMASVERAPSETLVLADVTRDDAYLRVPLEAAATLPAWR